MNGLGLPSAVLRTWMALPRLAKAKKCRYSPDTLNSLSLNRSLAPPRYAAGAHRSSRSIRSADHTPSDALNAVLTARSILRPIFSIPGRRFARSGTKLWAA
jgi:hypothetical protein